MANLKAEDIDRTRIVFIGNVMIDTLLDRLPSARERAVPAKFGFSIDGFVMATLQRPSNVDDPATLEICLRGLGASAEDRPVVIALHTRTSKQVEAFGLANPLKPLRVTEPLGYIEMLSWWTPPQLW